jgi:uncharacterized protein YyaL (SSP411 family)
MPQDPAPSLSRSRSPYLRHGARQPVNWLPWCDEAFERARRETRPILLDIGAVWCHWCHVMDRESYENEEIARLINDGFVAVKVDRDERPDVDGRYQRAVQALSGESGWPLTAFLTPEGEVFFGGTYFPPEEGRGRAEVARIWSEQRDRALGMARQVRERVSAHDQAESQVGEIAPGMVAAAADEFAHAFDFRHAGFGRGPKFPNAGALLFLLDRWLEGGEDWALRIVRETLDAMARGGVHDQLGGGFHRYATDARWLIPHFEKMAYDNGTLLEAYARAAAATGEPLFAGVAGGIVAWYLDVAGELLTQGGFPASQDADLGPGDDGDYWTWTEPEIEAALGEARLTRAAVLRYGLDREDAAMPYDPGRHVLYRARSGAEVAAALETTAEEAQALLRTAAHRLKEARDRRPRPLLDSTVYVGWSSLVASGFLAAARYLDRPEAAAPALRALDRIWDEAFDVEDGVVHRLGDHEGGYLEDQANFAAALLDAFEYTQRPDYLERARAVVAVLLARFADGEGGFQDRPQSDAGPTRPLQVPRRPLADAPEPAGNAVAALTLLRLSALLQDESLADRARVTLSVFAGSAPQMATSCATYFRALDWATSPVASCVVVAASRDAVGDALFRAALATPRPRLVVRRLEPGRLAEATLPPELAAMITGAAPRAYLCIGERCLQPVRQPDELAALLREAR